MTKINPHINTPQDECTNRVAAKGHDLERKRKREWRVECLSSELATCPTVDQSWCGCGFQIDDCALISPTEYTNTQSPVQSVDEALLNCGGRKLGGDIVILTTYKSVLADHE